MDRALPVHGGCDDNVSDCTSEGSQGKPSGEDFDFGELDHILASLDDPLDKELHEFSNALIHVDESVSEGAKEVEKDDSCVALGDVEYDNKTDVVTRELER